ncbi:MAG: translation initiation factor IF-3 [bacterium]|nr:translation initiation factor IF-3 [bacterium]
MKKLRKNTEIAALAVRVIGDGTEQLGLMPIEKALQLAQERGADLVEVSPKSKPPVCKLMDYGKYLYKLKKQDQHQKKMTKNTEVKGVRIGISTGDHDLDVKRRQAAGFLSENHLVKVVMIFKGRQLMHKELGKEKMLEFAESLKELSDIDSYPKHSGFQTIMVLKPKLNLHT